MSRDERALDKALSGATTPSDDELAGMVAMGEKIRNAYASFTPGHSPQRAMFVRAVRDGASSAGWTRFMAPATVTAVLLIGLLFVGRTSLPGDTFYPVRQALRNVGLAPASVEEVESLLEWADRLLDRAESVTAKDPEAAERLAFEATRVIGMAEGAFDELDSTERSQVTDELGELLARAKSILTEEPEDDKDRNADGKAVLRDDDDDEGADDDDDGDGDGDPSSNDRSNGNNSGGNEGNTNDPTEGRNGEDGNDGATRNDDDDEPDDTKNPNKDDEPADDDGDTKDDEKTSDGSDGKSGGDDDAADDEADNELDDEPEDEPTGEVEEPRVPDFTRGSRPRD